MLLSHKCGRGQIALSLLLVTFSVVMRNTQAGRDRGARCEKPDYIPNGSYRIRRDRVMRITCNAGFVLQGPKTIDCIRGKWDGDKPVCAKKGCKKELEQPENGRIQIENEVKAILYCSDNYNLAGNRHSYCNGTAWDRPIGNCRESKNIVQHECDFEADDVCGWTYEPREGLEWKRVMAANVFTTFKTGPRHDHTTLTANGGHYMLMESLTRQNDDVTLTSPIYERSLTLRTACCFQFYYFMYGAGVGDLFAVVKPVSLDLDDLLKNHKDLIMFQKYGNQNNIWNEHHFNIEELDEDFQILFVAKSGRGQLSDIAIDDVKLLIGDDCRALDSKNEDDLSNEEYASTTYESIFEMQSCVGHCFESPGSGLIRKFGHLKGLCNCDIDCEDNDTCCPDFKSVCFDVMFAQSTAVSDAAEATSNNEAPKNYSRVTEATTTSTTAKTTPKTVTTINTTPTAIITTQMSTKPTTARTNPTTTTSKTTPSPTTTSTSSSTAKSTTKRLTTPTTTTTTTPRTTTPITTHKTTPTTTRKTTPTTTTRKTTLSTTTPKTTASTTTTTHKITTKTTQATSRISTSTKITTSARTTPTTTKITTAAPVTSTISATVSPGGTSTRRPIPTSKPIEYIMNDKSKTEEANKGFSSPLLYVFFIIVIMILASVAYKRFGDRAVAWYMIRFKQNTSGDDDSASITTSFKSSHAEISGTNGNSKIAWRNKISKLKNTRIKNNMRTPLVNDEDEDDDDDIAENENIALKNNIFTEL